MTIASGILAYLADCYRENGSRFGLTSLGASRVRGSLVVAGEDAIVSRTVLDGQLFVPGAKAAQLATQAKLYEKECELFYGSIFVLGNLETGEARPKPVIAPLLIYPVSVGETTEEAGAEFVIDTRQRLLNDALLEALGDETLASRLESCIEANTHTEGCVGEIRRLFEELLPEVETEALLSYPHLLDEESLGRAALGRAALRHPHPSRSTGATLSLVPAATLILADRSTEMRGVLHDLGAMAAEPKTLSAPVRAILDPGTVPPVSRKPLRGEVPALLSEAQERVAVSAASRPLTLAVGPPGTGKSFTIAALAMEAVSRGESVLIASKMDHAVDVVADKIEAALGLPGICVRAGRKGYLKDLKRFLDDLLSGVLTAESVSKGEVAKRKASIRETGRAIEREEGHLERRSRREEIRGALLSSPAPGFFARWRIARIRRAVPKEERLHRIAARLAGRIDARLAEVVEHFRLARQQRLAESLQHHRATFQSFSKGIRARTSHRQDAYYEEVQWRHLLGALPVWLVNLSDLHRILPMEAELFDFVIIDEASQCDIASALPALQRAKRAVVTGDPKQLRHLSFLPLARQDEFAARHGLGETERERFHFRRVSLVDLVSESLASQEAVVFLNEHFRSRPGIIEFSNREFYAGKLAVMTGHREIDHRAEPSLSLHRIAGSRRDNGVNEAEIAAIFAQLDELVRSEGPPLSLGILSPFRPQVDAILGRLEKRPDLSRLLDRHGLLVGTAHSFQGEERDLVLLSLALDDDSPATSFRFLEKEDVFNVAITRARLENRLFVSFDPGKAGQGLLGRFLAHLAQVRENEDASKRVKPATEPSLDEVRKALENAGFALSQGFRLGGYELDLLARKEGKSLGIDLIGFPGPHAPAMGLERHLLWRRAGIRLFPLGLAEWQADREGLLAELERWLER